MYHLSHSRSTSEKERTKWQLRDYGVLHLLSYIFFYFIFTENAVDVYIGLYIYYALKQFFISVNIFF